MPNTAMNLHNPVHLTSHNQKAVAFEIMWVKLSVYLLDIFIALCGCNSWWSEKMQPPSLVPTMQDPSPCINYQTTMDQPLLLVKAKQSPWAEQTTASVRYYVGLRTTLLDASLLPWVTPIAAVDKDIQVEHLWERFKAFGNVLGVGVRNPGVYPSEVDQLCGTNPETWVILWIE